MTDAYGNPIGASSPTFSPVVGPRGVPVTVSNPQYQTLTGPAFIESQTLTRTFDYTVTGGVSGQGLSPSPTPVQFQVTFDTIGQIIPNTLGACLLPFKTLWIQGVDAVDDQLTITEFAPAGSTILAVDAVPPWIVPGLFVTGGSPDAFPPLDKIVSLFVDGFEVESPTLSDIPVGAVVNFVSPPGQITSPTVTFAAALCHPFDPTELGNIISIFDGINQIFTASGGVKPPASWSTADQAQMLAALEGMVIYPGDEAQLPSPLIVADKGAAATNAFRGIRYVTIPGWPFAATFNANLTGTAVATGQLGFPVLTFEWQRSNTGPIQSGPPPRKRPKPNIIAVEFAAGSG